MLDLSEIASAIRPEPEGFWSSPTVSAVSYEEEHNDICFEVEEESFWFIHRNQCILGAVHLFPPSGTFFDVGGGNGYVARALQDAGLEVVLVEPGLRGVRNARRRGVSHVVHGTLKDAGFHPDVLPAVGLFDVVEHIQGDGGFLSSVHAHLVPGGRVYITVPAFHWLWSHEDIDAGHCRRYKLSEICAVLKGGGFEIEYATYFFTFLLLPIYFSRALPFSAGISPKHDIGERVQNDHRINNGLAQRVIGWLSHRELRAITSGRHKKVGASCLVVARKPLQ
jgi:SAM-dependent methyltransferase